MVLNVCVLDGSEIIIDGFDTLSFYNELPVMEVSHEAYTWQREYYNDLLNYLCKYNFIGIKRNDPVDKLEYRDHPFAFQNQHFTENKILYLRTSSISTIIDMYN